MWFDFGRSENFPTQYPPNATPVTVDVLDAGFICAFIILLLCCYISVPKTTLKLNISVYVRVTVILIIGLFLMLGNFGQEWEVGHITTNTQYRAGTNEEVKAEIGVKIGLRSVNITLKRAPDSNKTLIHEIIDYNERFEWTWDQGRFGFGPYAGKLQQEFRAAQYRGLPLPILWILDYFVIDGEGYRLGRFYRTAGWYSHIAMWTAFPCWLISLVFFRSVIHYGAYFLGITGICQLVANLTWLVVRNPIELEVPFEDAILTTKYGPSFWITFITGSACVLLSIIILILERLCNKETYEFFGVDPLNNFEISYISPDEMEVLMHENKSNDIKLQKMERGVPVKEDKMWKPVRMRRGTVRRSASYHKITKPRFDSSEDEPIYGNQDVISKFQNI